MKFTPEQMKTIEAAAALRMEMCDIASLVGVGKTQLELMIKRDDAVGRAIAEGRARASAKVGSVLLKKCLAGDDKALMLWYKFIEQRSSLHKIHHSGPNEGPIEINIQDPEAIEARIKELEERAKA